MRWSEEGDPQAEKEAQSLMDIRGQVLWSSTIVFLDIFGCNDA
ncbi:hypothetical protein [Stutzerimonas xanthomarina]